MYTIVLAICFVLMAGAAIFLGIRLFRIRTRNTKEQLIALLRTNYNAHLPATQRAQAGIDLAEFLLCEPPPACNEAGTILNEIAAMPDLEPEQRTYVHLIRIGIVHIIQDTVPGVEVFEFEENKMVQTCLAQTSLGQTSLTTCRALATLIAINHSIAQLHTPAQCAQTIVTLEAILSDHNLPRYVHEWAITTRMRICMLIE